MIRVASLGLGTLGRMECSAYSEIDGFELVAGVDINSSARNAFLEKFDRPTYNEYGKMLDEENIDAVNIVTPHTLHYEQTKEALERDLHVFLEKPMVTSVKDAKELISIAEERDLILQVGYQRHVDPAFINMKEIVDSGEIGDPHMVACYLGQEWISAYTDSWRTNPELSGGGQLYDSGSHLLDSMLWVTDTEPVSVAATMDAQGNAVDINSSLAATLDRDGDTVTASIGITGDGVSLTESLVIWGTDGRIQYESGGKIDVETNDNSRKIEPEEVSYMELTRRKLEAFRAAIEGRRECAVPGEFGLQVTKLTEAAYKACKSDRTVVLDG